MFNITVSDENLSFPYDTDIPFGLKEPEKPLLTSLCLLYDFVSNGFISTFFPFKSILPLETTFTPESIRLFLLSYVKPLLLLCFSLCKIESFPATIKISPLACILALLVD